MITYTPGLFQSLDGDLNMHLVLSLNNDDLIFLIEITDVSKSLKSKFIKINFI